MIKTTMKQTWRPDCITFKRDQVSVFLAFTGSHKDHINEVGPFD